MNFGFGSLQRYVKSFLFLALLACGIIVRPEALAADQIPVRHIEGVTHGFLVLRTLQGDAIADGDLRQVVKQGRVTDHLLFRFKDGSVHEETTTYTQRGEFRLVSDQLVQKGPSFKHPVETSIDASTGQVTMRFTENGNQKVVSERLELPPDVSNGFIFTLLKNIQPSVPQTTVSMVAASSKPRLVRLNISPQGQKTFLVGNISHKATHYVLKVEIGSASGVVAKLIGREPPDTHVWVLEGEAPALVESEGPLYEGGPIWRMELAVPNISR